MLSAMIKGEMVTAVMSDEQSIRDFYKRLNHGSVINITTASCSERQVWYQLYKHVTFLFKFFSLTSKQNKIIDLEIYSIPAVSFNIAWPSENQYRNTEMFFFKLLRPQGESEGKKSCEVNLKDLIEMKKMLKTA